MKFVFQQSRIAFAMLLLFTVVTGILYPGLFTAIAQAVFPAKANGSIIERNGKVVGSELIGQPFTSPRYFWGRLSDTSPYPYNSAASSGSNYAPTNPALFDQAKGRVDQLHGADSLNQDRIPIDLVTASGSGLDPDISVAAARYQISRVASTRNLSVSVVRDLVDRTVTPRTFGILGEPRVNVLKLNLALDRLQTEGAE